MERTLNRMASVKTAKRISDLTESGIDVRKVSADRVDSEVIARTRKLADEHAEREFAEKVDLIAMYRRDPALFPIELGMWNILIQKVQPAPKMGIIEKTASQMQAEEYLTVIGKVILCGPSALEGKTESGILLKDLTATIKTPEQLIGKYVIHQPFTGADIWFAPLPSIKLKFITATEILAVTTMPSMFMRP